jgi:mRNA interferase MazF
VADTAGWYGKDARERLGLIISSDVFNNTDVPVVIVAEVTDRAELRDSLLSDDAAGLPGSAHPAGPVTFMP